MSIPYTYLIGWTKLDKWYYGLQYGKNANPKNLWITYFTSSPIVKKFRDEHGEPDIVQVRKIFSDEKTAKNWEPRVLKKLDVLKNNKWLNENIAGAISLDFCSKGGQTKKGKPFFGKRTKEEIDNFYKKASIKRKGKPSNNKGKSCPESAKKLKREKLLGRKKPNHMREALSKTRKGSKRIYRDDGTYYMEFLKSIDS